MVWHSHRFKNFPQFVVIHTVKCFGIVNKAEVENIQMQLKTIYSIFIKDVLKGKL